MSNYNRDQAVKLFGMADSDSDNEAVSSFNATRAYLKLHEKSFREFFATANETIRLIDPGMISDIDGLNHENESLNKQVIVLKQQVEEMPTTHAKLVASLEAQVSVQKSENNKQKDQILGLKRKVAETETSLARVKGKGFMKGAFAGAAAAVVVGALVGQNKDVDIGAELRVASVAPFSILGKKAESVSQFVPPFLWYRSYLTVKTEFANIRMAETAFSPALSTVQKDSCIMVLAKSKRVPDWVKVEQRVDGKLVTGFMSIKDQQLDAAYIGKRCKAFAYE